MRAYLYLLMLCLPLHIFAANYYCGTDEGYVKYLQGSGKLDGVTSYTAKENCASNCKTYNHCDAKTKNETIFAIDGAIKLNESDKIKFEGLLAGRSINNILINSNGTAGTYDFSSSPINGNLFKFPTSFSNDPLNPIVVNVAYSNGNDFISLKSVNEVTSYTATCDSNDILVSGLCKKDTNTTYAPNCKNGGSLSATTCYKFTGTSYYQIGASKNSNDLSMVTSSKYIDPNTEQEFASSFYFNAEAALNGYTCTKLKGQIQKGDLAHNFFSSNSECETNCAVQNDCFAVSEEEEGCEVTDLQYANPVTDYTGKTVYSQMNKTLKCTKMVTEQTGCDAYKLSNSFNTVNYDVSSIGYRYNTYSGLEEAAATSLMSEQMQHLFSGWKGKCDNGMRFDNPFNDPMKILSYAMMVYSAAGSEMFEGTTVGAVHDQIETAFDTTANKLSDALSTAQETVTSSSDPWLEASTSVNEATTYGSTIQGTTTLDTALTDSYLANIPGVSVADKIAKMNTAWGGNLQRDFFPYAF